MGLQEVLALRTYDMPVADAVMGYLSQAPLKAGLSSAAVMAVALGLLSAFLSQARDRAAQVVLALAVGSYAILGMPVSIPALWLYQVAFGADPLLPLGTSVPPHPFGPGFSGILDLSDIIDGLGAAVWLVTILARVGAVGAAVGLLWPRRRSAQPVAMYVVPSQAIPDAPSRMGSVRTSGG
jgi:hypothetical protein